MRFSVTFYLLTNIQGCLTHGKLRDCYIHTTYINIYQCIQGVINMFTETAIRKHLSVHAGPVINNSLTDFPAPRHFPCLSDHIQAIAAITRATGDWGGSWPPGTLPVYLTIYAGIMAITEGHWGLGDSWPPALSLLI